MTSPSSRGMQLRHILEFLERKNLDDVASGPGFEGRGLPGKRIDSLSCLHRWLVNQLDFEYSRKNEKTSASFPKAFFDLPLKCIKHRGDLFTGQIGFPGNRPKQLTLGQRFGSVIVARHVIPRS